MKRPILGLLSTLLCLTGYGEDTLENRIDNIMQRMEDKQNGPTPQIDPKRIINASSSFLKEREPEMTAEEYALYENVVTMLEKKPTLAIKLLEGMVEEKKEPSPAFSFILGNAYYAAGQVEKAEKSYRRAVDKFPDFIRAWNNLGILYYTDGRFEQGANCFNKSVALGDRTPMTFGLLGCCLEKTGDVIAAEQSLMQAVAADPANGDWKEALLRIYVESRQFGPAEALIKNLIKLKPTETRHWLTYANILLSSGRKPEAIVLLDVAREAGVAGPDELTLLADLYAEQNLSTEAIALYRQVLPVAPQVGEQKLLRFAQLFISSGKLAEAQKTLEALGPQVSAGRQVEYYQTRADLQMARKRWPEARVELEALLALEPLHGRALLRLGRTYTAEENYVRAGFAFEAAYRLPETCYHASLELANLQLRDRHYDKAAQYLEEALSIEKSDQIADYLERVRGLITENN